MHTGAYGIFSWGVILYKDSPWWGHPGKVKKMHFMNKYLPVLLVCAIGLLASPTLLYTQADKGFALWEKGDLSSAETVLRGSITDPKTGPYALYGLALVYADERFERRQLDSAFAFIEACNLAYRKMPPDLKSKIVKKLSTTKIADQRKAIIELAARRAKDQGTPDAYDQFLEHFTKPPASTKRKAVAERNTLVLASAEQSGNWETVKALLEKYETSLAADSPAIYRQMQELLFQFYTRAKGLEAFPSFRAAFPANIVAGDTLKGILDRALADPGVRLLESFTDTYPNSPFRPFAIDTLASRLSLNGTEADCRRFLSKFPIHPGAKAVWARYYSTVLQNTTEPERLEKFMQENPQFPFPERVNTDIAFLAANRERLEFEAFEAQQEPGPGFQFLQRYPESTLRDTCLNRVAVLILQKDPADAATKKQAEYYLRQYPESPKSPRLWKHLYAGVHAHTTDPAKLEQFLRDHPQYPFAEQVKSDINYLLDNREQLDFKAFSQMPSVNEGFGFLERFPQSTYQAQVKQRMADLLLLPNSRAADIEKFLSAYPMPDRRQALLKRLYDLVSKDLSVETLTGFENNYPDFSDKNRLAADMARAKAAPRDLSTLKAEDLNRRAFAPNINSARDDYAPILSADGRTLYLCRNTTGSEDIFSSQQNENGEWPAPLPVSAWNTSNRSEAPESISADGNEFYLFRNGKFFISRKTVSGWSTPEELPAPFNQFSYQADLSIAADGKALLFAARPGYGSLDIHVSLLQEGNTWSEPFSLGPTINTSRTDRSPFIHPDGKTLYFSSEGHGGFGASDIFMSRRLDDSWTKWSKPVNLGPAINTNGNDWGFRVSTDGQYAYYTAYAGGNTDIVRCDLPQAIRPDEVATITGKMTDTEGRPLDAEILWEDLSTGEVVQVTRTNPGTGEFFAVLPERSRYGYSVRKPGYFPLAGNVDLRNNLGEIRLDKPMELATLDEMKLRDIALPLNNLFFETAKYDIQPESFPELNRLAQLLLDGEFSIEIQGHTDNVGSDAANQLLSENRARAVREYLIRQGCDGGRISSKGFGETRPKAGNDTDAGRALNRRVEIRIRS